MLSLLLITALVVQYPAPASKPAQDTSATKRATATTRAQQAAPKDDSRAAAVSRMVFHDRMRELWNDHIVYTRNVIVSVAAGSPDTAEVLQRLLRNQDELGEAIKPYYGDAAGSQLASLLRTHIQHAGKALAAAKGMTDTTRMQTRDTVQIKSNSQYPATDSTSLTQAIAALRANADSIATFLSTANPRGFARETLWGGLQMHINLLLQEVTAHFKKDWSGSIAAFDQSVDQALQMADMLSEGVMKQFPTRFTNKATTVSSLRDRWDAKSR